MALKLQAMTGGMMQLASRDSMDLHVKSTHTNGRVLKLEALVISKNMSAVPSYHVAFDSKWKNLADLKSADPDFGTSSSVDILLGADLFSHTVLSY